MKEVIDEVAQSQIYLVLWAKVATSTLIKETVVSVLTVGFSLFVGAISGLQENCKLSTEFLYTTFPIVSTITNIQHCALQLMNQHL